MSEGAERVGFSQEMVNAFTTIAANGRGYIFTSKLKTNLKKIFHLQSVLQEKVILSVGGCVCVCASYEQNVQGGDQSRKPARLYTPSVYTFCKDRQNERNIN